jgi:hypothetical protein
MADYPEGVLEFNPWCSPRLATENHSIWCQGHQVFVWAYGFLIFISEGMPNRKRMSHVELPVRIIARTHSAPTSQYLPQSHRLELASHH